MSNIRNIGDTFDKLIKDSEVTKYTYTLSESKKQELNLEDGDFKLMRTVFDNYGSLKVFEDNKMGSVGGNDISEEGLKKLIDDSLAAARSASGYRTPPSPPRPTWPISCPTRPACTPPCWAWRCSCSSLTGGWACCAWAPSHWRCWSWCP